MSTLNNKIGTRITDLRKKASLTQESLAEKLDISVKHCSEVERGLSRLSLEKLIQTADLFDVSLDYLVRGKSAIPPTVIELFQNQDAKEQQLLTEYLILFHKIRNK